MRAHERSLLPCRSINGSNPCSIRSDVDPLSVAPCRFFSSPASTDAPTLMEITLVCICVEPTGRGSTPSTFH